MEKWRLTSVIFNSSSRARAEISRHPTTKNIGIGKNEKKKKRNKKKQSLVGGH